MLHGSGSEAYYKPLQAHFLNDYTGLKALFHLRQIEYIFTGLTLTLRRIFVNRVINECFYDKRKEIDDALKALKITMFHGNFFVKKIGQGKNKF